jgi:thiol-disulfide isomerase/thioredoxin
MKKLLAFLLALLLLTGCAANTPAEVPAAEEAPATEEAPAEEAVEPAYLGDFSAQMLTGETLDQSFFANADLTVINVWATYCGPCKQEMPVLGALDKELENVQVLGIVTDVTDQKGEPDDSQVELALELLEAYGCEYPNLILNQSLAMLGFASLQAVPATLFVDSNGNLAGMGFYGALDEENWRAAIDERLELVQP